MTVPGLKPGAHFWTSLTLFWLSSNLVSVEKKLKEERASALSTETLHARSTSPLRYFNKTIIAQKDRVNNLRTYAVEQIFDKNKE